MQKSLETKELLEEFKKGSILGMDTLIREYPSIEVNALIRYSSYYGHLEIAKELLKDSRVDPSVGDNMAFRWACSRGNIAIVEELLKDPRVDPSTYNNYGFRVAIINNNLELVSLLIKYLRVHLKMVLEPSKIQSLRNENMAMYKILQSELE